MTRTRITSMALGLLVAATVLVPAAPAHAAAPTISTAATPNAIPLGAGTLSDFAFLSGGQAPSGIITFRLYGPNDATCTGAPVFTSAVPVNGIGNANSAAFTPTAAGVYRWVASYGGDVNNTPVAGACGDPNETVIVFPATPTIATTASLGGPIGTSVNDSATLTGGQAPTGTITFRLYGPNDATCTGAPAFTSAPVPVNGNGVYSSGPFTPTSAGTYRWVATYSGDANNNAVAGACNDPNETVVIATAGPALTTTASGGGPIGTSVNDSATLAGGQAPTGTITFRLYGPNDATCTGAPAFTSAAVPVTGNGVYSSGPFTPTSAGTYRWVATYSGDANNNAVAGACNDPNETVVIGGGGSGGVIGNGPALTTTASGGGPIGTTVFDTATLAGGQAPTGTITFRLYGPGDATCTGAPAFTSAPVAVTGNGAYSSGPFTPTSPGTYRWIATYSGDANNNAVAGACNAANETVVISSAPPTVQQRCRGIVATIVGHGGPIVGTSGRDVIVGTNGAERILGARGNDLICGRGGADLIRGGRGADKLFGGAGPDTFFGGRGDDRCQGGRGRDHGRC